MRTRTPFHLNTVRRLLFSWQFNRLCLSLNAYGVTGASMPPVTPRLRAYNGGMVLRPPLPSTIPFLTRAGHPSTVATWGQARGSGRDRSALPRGRRNRLLPARRGREVRSWPPLLLLLAAIFQRSRGDPVHEFAGPAHLSRIPLGPAASLGGHAGKRAILLIRSVTGSLRR